MKNKLLYIVGFATVVILGFGYWISFWRVFGSFDLNGLTKVGENPWKVDPSEFLVTTFYISGKVRMVHTKGGKVIFDYIGRYKSIGHGEFAYNIPEQHKDRWFTFECTIFSDSFTPDGNGFRGLYYKRLGY